MRRVSVFMDVEDPINALADDAALEFAQLFTECGVRGSFCITGEKCRTLLTRGRLDVAEAFLPHCLGLHTDTHSQHPTTMELLADVDYKIGCQLAFDAEKRGYEAFVALFGRAPAFWGGAGNTWSPEITDALKRLAIPAYSYALTGVPDGGIHRFNGVVALPQHISISESQWSDPSHQASTPNLREEWTAIFVGHPTRFRYAEFWDKPYAYGRTPIAPEPVEPVDNESYEQGKAKLRDFLKRLAEEAQIVGVDDLLSALGPFRPATEEERAYFDKHMADALRAAARWPIHRPELNVDRIVDKTLAMAGTLDVPIPERR